MSKYDFNRTKYFTYGANGMGFEEECKKEKKNYKNRLSFDSFLNKKKFIVYDHHIKNSPSQ